MHPFCFSSSSSASSLLVLHLLLLLLLRLSSPSLAWAPVSRTITVDRQGRGDFSTVQSAVDSVPDGNRDWVKVHVNAGSYWEKVTIPKQKDNILLEGDGSSSTDISFNAHAHAGIDQIMRHPNAELDEYSPTFLSATFTVLADNFVARDISFKSIYEDCVLASVMPPPGTTSTTQQPGWVTAHARLHAGSPGGMVFKGGAVTGTGRIYLGRAWNGFATVVFYGTRMDDVVVPQGWEAWNAGNDV
ncbi:hypothetical protein HU200_052170 [Digitaria exilis]|uniref:pectinesterase n=1 Tax=Digitaria exilis TaxID=1010633 RepID=A0A835APZ1_9POAL|nr:hypothetical protein HU200_052170 [Digitaria exilis]